MSLFLLIVFARLIPRLHFVHRAGPLAAAGCEARGFAVVDVHELLPSTAFRVFDRFSPFLEFFLRMDEEADQHAWIHLRDA